MLQVVHKTMTEQMSSVQSATVLLVTLAAFFVQPSMAMCETRCEQSIPTLNRLRELWSRSYKRVGDIRVSFEQFLLSLIQTQSRDNHVMRRLRASILRIIGRYQDCVMACEHQFSKRNSPSIKRSWRTDSLCERLLLHRHDEPMLKAATLPLISHFCSLHHMEKLAT